MGFRIWLYIEYPPKMEANDSNAEKGGRIEGKRGRIDVKGGRLPPEDLDGGGKSLRTRKRQRKS